MAGQTPHVPVIVIVMGVSGVGKSTLAQALTARTHWSLLEGDDLHPSVNIARMRAGRPLDDADRLPWLRAIGRWIHQRAAAGSDGIVTCSALTRRYREVLRAAAGPGVDVRFVCLIAGPDVLERRLAGRQGHFMPVSLLDSQLEALEPLEPDEPGLTLDVGVHEHDPHALAVLVDTVLAALPTHRT